MTAPGHARVRAALAPLALSALMLACASDGTTAPGTERVTVYDTPPGPAWNGTASAVAVGDRANCLRNTDGTVWCWGNTRGVGLRVDIGLRNVPNTSNSDIVIDSICIAKRVDAQHLPGWPCNVFKPVRMSTKVFASITVPMLDGPLCAIDAGGTAYCWDQGASVVTAPDSTTTGGLAWCGSTLCLFQPQPFRTAVKLASLAPNSTACAVSTAGVVLCRGSNFKNLLGNQSLNLTTDTLVPVLGAPTSTAVTASPDGYFGCAIATTGKVWCWGESLYGAVGNGSFSQTISTPTQITSAANFKALASTLNTNCGLTTAGAAYCWGDGRMGQIAWGGLGWSTTPALVLGGHTFASITAGPGHLCALDGAGAARCWGDNQFGQLGATPAICTGGPICAFTPVAVSGGHTVRQLAAGIAHTCGVTLTNQVYCWGIAQYGRLGLQLLTTPYIATPTLIGP